MRRSTQCASNTIVSDVSRESSWLSIQRVLVVKGNYRKKNRGHSGNKSSGSFYPRGGGAFHSGSWEIWEPSADTAHVNNASFPTESHIWFNEIDVTSWSTNIKNVFQNPSGSSWLIKQQKPPLVSAESTKRRLQCSEHFINETEIHSSWKCQRWVTEGVVVLRTNQMFWSRFCVILCSLQHCWSRPGLHPELCGSNLALTGRWYWKCHDQQRKLSYSEEKPPQRTKDCPAATAAWSSRMSLWQKVWQNCKWSSVSGALRCKRSSRLTSVLNKGRCRTFREHLLHISRRRCISQNKNAPWPGQDSRDLHAQDAVWSSFLSAVLCLPKGNSRWKKLIYTQKMSTTGLCTYIYRRSWSIFIVLLCSIIGAFT